MLAGIHGVDIGSGDPNRCEALRLGVGMAVFPLEIARCHLEHVRAALGGADAPRVARLIRALRLDAVSADVEVRAADLQDRALACLNPHRAAGEAHHALPVGAPATARPLLPAEDYPGGRIEF